MYIVTKTSNYEETVYVRHRGPGRDGRSGGGAREGGRIRGGEEGCGCRTDQRLGRDVTHVFGAVAGHLASRFSEDLPQLGGSTRQRSITNGHRAANRQPGGGVMRVGISPEIR